MKVRVLNSNGETAVFDRIQLLHKQHRSKSRTLISEAELHEIRGISSNEDYLEPLLASDPDIDEDLSFVSSFEFGKYLSQQVFLNYSGSKLEKNGLWTWLALIYLDQLVERKPEGQYKLLAYERYVFDQSARLRYNRHVAFFSWYAFDHLGNLSKIALHTPMHVSGDIPNQIAKDIVLSNPNIIRMCDEHFYSEANGKYSKGFTGKVDAPGSLRRLVSIIIPQLQYNYDLRELSAEKIFSLLPQDFIERSLAQSSIE